MDDLDREALSSDYTGMDDLDREALFLDSYTGMDYLDMEALLWPLLPLPTI